MEMHTGRSCCASSRSRSAMQRIEQTFERPGGVPAADEDEDERLAAIRQRLDEQVRPYLQGDGGDLYVLGLEDNVLKVHYQGACGSCPSSISGTLAGIEGLVRQIDPAIEVIAV